MDWRPWMDAFLPPLLEALPGRVAFVGIQGSFGRGGWAGERRGSGGGAGRAGGGGAGRLPGCAGEDALR
ncbi:MAG: hypothetical protein ACLRWQ_09250 [Flavonifractor plautii]